MNDFDFSFSDERPSNLVVKGINEKLDIATNQTRSLKNEHEKTKQNLQSGLKEIKVRQAKNYKFIVITGVIIVLLVLVLVLILDSETSLITLPESLPTEFVRRAHDILEKLLDILVAPIVLGMFFFKIESFRDYLNAVSDEVEALQTTSHKALEDYVESVNKIAEFNHDMSKVSAIAAKYDGLFSDVIIANDFLFNIETGLLRRDGKTYDFEEYTTLVNEEREVTRKRLYDQERFELVTCGLWHKYVDSQQNIDGLN